MTISFVSHVGRNFICGLTLDLKTYSEWEHPFNNKQLTLSRLQTLFGRTRLGKTGFQIKGSDLIQNIAEDRLMHTSCPVHYHPIRHKYNILIELS